MSSIQQTYPLALTDLTKDHLDQLIRVLSIDNSPPKDCDRNPSGPGRIKEEIKKLPWDLRRHAFIRIVPNALVQPAILCDRHTGLNPYVINHIFTLIKREVTEYLKRLERYTGEVDPEIRLLLTELKGIRGLWRSDPELRSYLKYMKVSHQHNRCEACMLVQIIDTPTWLQNIRTTLLSRTRTRAKPGRPHRAPQLLRFIDGGINTHPNLITELYYQSGQKAYGLKAVRKLAVQEYKRAYQGKDRGDDMSEDEQFPDDNYRKHETIVVYWDQEAAAQTETGNTMSSRTAVETSGSETAVDDTDQLQVMHGKPTPRQGAPRKTTPSEDLLNEIIAEYAGLTGTESMKEAEKSLLDLQPDLAPPTPLSITKPKTKSPPVSPVSSWTSSLGKSWYAANPYGETETPKPPFASPDESTGERKSVYRAPRGNINWKKIIHDPSPLDKLSSRAVSAFRDINGTAERIAVEYRDLLSPQTAAYSESEYSNSPPVKECSRPPTTWELLCENMDIEYPRPRLKETKKGKGLLRKFSVK